jgi:hypothetical protein
MKTYEVYIILTGHSKIAYEFTLFREAVSVIF